MFQVTQQTFESEVLHSPMLVLVDFFATWCPPCRQIDPMLEEVAHETVGKAQVVKVMRVAGVDVATIHGWMYLN